MRKCGNCKWFDGDACLEDDGTGKGECHVSPPIWVGPSPAAVNEGVWVEFLMDDGWACPMVGVAHPACEKFEKAKEKRWWER